MTASLQQFLDDYMIVIENDESAWEYHKSVINDNDNVSAVADVLRDEFEEYVGQSLDKIDPSHNAWQVNVMREMLLGWGVTPYEHLAREIVARIEEGK
jgi:hypothetical protein